jgi:hypothetical protein
VELWRQRRRWRRPCTDLLGRSLRGDADYLHSASWSSIEVTRRRLCLSQSLLPLGRFFLCPSSARLDPHAATRNLDVSIALGWTSSPHLHITRNLTSHGPYSLVLQTGGLVRYITITKAFYLPAGFALHGIIAAGCPHPHIPPPCSQALRVTHGDHARSTSRGVRRTLSARLAPVLARRPPSTARNKNGRNDNGSETHSTRQRRYKGSGEAMPADGEWRTICDRNGMPWRGSSARPV